MFHDSDLLLMSGLDDDLTITTPEGVNSSSWYAYRWLTPVPDLIQRTRQLITEILGVANRQTDQLWFAPGSQWQHLSIPDYRRRHFEVEEGPVGTMRFAVVRRGLLESDGL